MRRLLFVWMTAAMVLAVAVPASAQHNPCNPCSGKKAANPCNPCGGKSMNPCNPCGGGGGHAAMPPVNPCHAKMGTVFYVSDPMGRNTVTFESSAPLEDIVGTTNQISGYVVFDPHNPARGGRGQFTVPVASLRTGIPLRDEHLRGPEWLNAEAHPHITFHIEATRDPRLVKKTDAFQTWEMTAVGPFTLNGVTRELRVPVRLTYLKESPMTRAKAPGNLLVGRAEFEVPLAKYGVAGFQDVIGSKVGETIAVSVSFFASDAAQTAANPCNPCNPCGGKAMNPCNPCGGKHHR